LRKFLQCVEDERIEQSMDEEDIWGQLKNTEDYLEGIEKVAK